MPQLDTSTYVSQIFWLILSFLSLWFMLSWFIIPKIEDIIEQRRKKIDGYILKAEKINKQALQSLEKYENALNKAKEDAESKIAANKADLEKSLAEKRQEIEETLNKKIAESEYRIAKERQETLAVINDVSMKLAVQILHKLEISDISAQELQDSLSKKE